jgi:ribosomal protein L37AE/L43A
MQSQMSLRAFGACTLAKATSLAIDCCDAVSRRSSERKSSRIWNGSMLGSGLTGGARSWQPLREHQKTA